MVGRFRLPPSRFGGAGTAASGASQVSPAGAFGVLKAPTGFVRAGAGDQILTVLPGGETAYIAQARWVSPAQVLFDEALERAFDADPGRARLIGAIYLLALRFISTGAQLRAEAMARAFEAHVSHLLIHGFLHLIGYDHIESEDAKVMEPLEVKILAGLGWPDPYATGSYAGGHHADETGED